MCTTKLDMELIKLWNDGVDGRVLTGYEIADILNISSRCAYDRICYLRKSGFDVKSRMGGSREYTIYKGDEFVCAGTVRDISKQLSVSISTVYCWASPSLHKRSKGKGHLAYRL